MLSDGSIGEMVRPMRRHWIMWAIMSRYRMMRLAARHLAVRDLAMPPSGEAEETLAITGSWIERGAAAGWLTQPSFINCNYICTGNRVNEYYTGLD